MMQKELSLRKIQVTPGTLFMGSLNKSKSNLPELNQRERSLNKGRKIPEYGEQLRRSENESFGSSYDSDEYLPTIKDYKTRGL
jgi:hypothetical protein